MNKCGSCGGVYEPVGADGLAYFHACPPLSPAEIKDGLAKKTLTLPPATQAKIDAATQLDTTAPVPLGQATHVDQTLATIVVERPNKRDENVTGPAPPGQPAPIKSPGAGVTKM